MTAKNIIICAMLIAHIVFASLALGQVVWTTTYQSNGSRQVVDNLPQMTSPSYNTWHNMNVALIDVYAGSSGYAEGVDANHCIWQQDTTDPNNWAQDTYACVFVQVVVRDITYRYGLSTSQASQGCSGNYYPFSWWDAANGNWNAWGAAQNACLLKGSLTVSGNGMICGIDTANRPVCQNAFENQGNSFQEISGVPAGTYINIVPVHDALAYIATASAVGKCVIGGTIAAMTCTYTAFPVLSGLQMITGDSEGFIYAIGSTSSGTNVYRLNAAHTAWPKIYGLIANRISVAGSQHIYATTSAGALYRTAENTVALTSTLTGHTICNGGCPPGSSHTPNDDGAMTVLHLGNDHIVCGAVPPATDVNCGITNTPIDAMWCMLDRWPGGTECDIVGTAFMQCAVMGVVFSQSINTHPPAPPGTNLACILGKEAGQPHRFARNSTINVYFDAGAWPSGSCPQAAYCQFFNGLSSWAHVTLLNYSFTNKGVVTPNCGKSGYPYGLYTMPCNPSYPFIFVSNNKNTNPLNTECNDIVSGTCSGEIKRNSKGQYTVVGVAARVAGGGSASIHDRTATGAHEFGHIHNLPDCKGLPICWLDEAHTVMWKPMTANGPIPTAPTACDISWADIYGLKPKETP